MTSARKGPSGWRPLLRISSRVWLGDLAEDEATLWVADGSGPRRRVDLDVLLWCLPLLERPYRDVREDCDRVLMTVGTSTRRALDRVVPGGVVEDAPGASQATRHAARRVRRSWSPG